MQGKVVCVSWASGEEKAAQRGVRDLAGFVWPHASPCQTQLGWKGNETSGINDEPKGGVQSDAQCSPAVVPLVTTGVRCSLVLFLACCISAELSSAVSTVCLLTSGPAVWICADRYVLSGHISKWIRCPQKVWTKIAVKSLHQQPHGQEDNRGPGSSDNKTEGIFFRNDSWT